MLRHILPLIPEHRIYTEPFFGGGAVFRAKEPAQIEFINDHNGEAINFCRVLKLRCPELKQEIGAAPHSGFRQKQARQIYRNPEGSDPVKRAWAVYALPHQPFCAIPANTRKYSRNRSDAPQRQAVRDKINELEDMLS
jgi:DNA adenine methylase